VAPQHTRDVYDANRRDTLTRQPERGSTAPGMSPMDPPDAYAPPAMAPVPRAELHPCLSELCEDHSRFARELDAVEAAVRAVPAGGFGADAQHTLEAFFETFEREVIPHSQREELTVFPLLGQRLLAAGEHSKGPIPMTAVDVMRHDHVKAIQLEASARTGFRLAGCLTDAHSRHVVLDASLRQTLALVELLRLHMFREDNIVFALAHRLLTADELDRRQPQAQPRPSLDAR
jgi:iron-sulfur cluster repair protein YtfE (RIC family)